MAFSIIASAIPGLNSKYSVKASPTKESTIPRTSGFPNRVLVCPSNSGSGTFAEITAVRPSLIFSPPKFASPSLSLFRLRAIAFKVRVKTVFNPSKWVPPSIVLILLAKPKTVSL